MSRNFRERLDRGRMSSKTEILAERGERRGSENSRSRHGKQKGIKRNETDRGHNEVDEFKNIQIHLHREKRRKRESTNEDDQFSDGKHQATPPSEAEEEEPEIKWFKSEDMMVAEDEASKILREVTPTPEEPPYLPAIMGCRSVEEFQCLNK